MALQLCPHCHRPVAAAAARCEACGRGLSLDDTVPAAFDATPRGAPEPASGPLRLTLRPFGAEPPPQASRSTLDLLIETDRPGPAGSPATDKSAMRAAVRRARLRRAAPAECAEVLVHDPDEAARAPLCALLEGFGFQIQLARDHEHAIAIASGRCLAAAFVDVTLGDEADDDTIALCRALKGARRSPGGAPAALLLYSARVTPVEWIRAQLAGCDALITKPARRGDVARALETCAVALPADARRR